MREAIIFILGMLALFVLVVIIGCIQNFFKGFIRGFKKGFAEAKKEN